MIMIRNCPCNFIYVCVIVIFFTKLLILAILFSAAVRAVVLAKLVIQGISPLTLFILALKVVLVAKWVISGILSSISFILALYTSFLTTSFLLHHLVYLKQQEQVQIINI